MHPAKIELYKEMGYVEIPELFSANEIRLMHSECTAILAGDYGRLYNGAIQYQDNGSTKTPFKITAVVERSLVFRKLCTENKILNYLIPILGSDILLLRDIILLKPALIGKRMQWHQDSNHWAIEPPDLCTIWVALEDSLKYNGCLRVIPKSHKQGIVKTSEDSLFINDEKVSQSEIKELEVKSGSVVFMNSMLVHDSNPNLSDSSRWSFIASFMNSKSKWLKEPTRKRFMKISGQTYAGFVMSTLDLNGKQQNGEK